MHRLQETHGEAAVAQEERLAGLTQAQVKLVKELLKRNAASAGAVLSSAHVLCTNGECDNFNLLRSIRSPPCLPPLLLRQSRAQAAAAAPRGHPRLALLPCRRRRHSPSAPWSSPLPPPPS